MLRLLSNKIIVFVASELEEEILKNSTIRDSFVFGAKIDYYFRLTGKQTISLWNRNIIIFHTLHFITPP